MRINNNIMAMNTHRQYSVNTASVAKSTEKLSSGYRINRAGDDAAGLAISEKMRAQIRGLRMASKNSQDAISLVQTSEGALQETHNILQRMRELAVQSASDTNETNIDRAALNAEFQQLIAEIDDTALKTKFNDMGVIDGSYQAGKTVTITGGAVKATDGKFYAGVGLESGTYTITAAADGDGNAVFSMKNGTETIGDLTVKKDDIQYEKDLTYNFTMSNGSMISVKFDAAIDTAANLGIAFTGGQVVYDNSNAMVIQTGANRKDELGINIDKMDAQTLGVKTQSIATREKASIAIHEVNNALNVVSNQRAALGALQNRLNHKISNLDTSAENLSAAESRIRDLDMALEMTTFTRNNIITQASTAMLAQANAAPQGVLNLLG